MGCYQDFRATDTSGAALPFNVLFNLYDSAGNRIYTPEIEPGSTSRMYLQKGTHEAIAENVDGWIAPDSILFEACTIPIVFVYTISETCTQSFTASSNVGEPPFTPQVLIYIGYVEQPWTLVGAWNLPAEVEDLEIDTVYTARPIVPSSYTEDDFTAPEAVTFTACTDTIDFAFSAETNGGVNTVLIPVVSTNLKAVGWSYFAPTIQLLEVEFLSGSLYLYFDVPGEIFYGLLLAPSKGFYFWLYIRCKTFDCSGGDIPYQYVKLR